MSRRCSGLSGVLAFTSNTLATTSISSVRSLYFKNNRASQDMLYHFEKLAKIKVYDEICFGFLFLFLNYQLLNLLLTLINCSFSLNVWYFENKQTNWIFFVVDFCWSENDESKKGSVCFEEVLFPFVTYHKFSRIIFDSVVCSSYVEFSLLCFWLIGFLFILVVNWWFLFYRFDVLLLFQNHW